MYPAHVPTTSPCTRCLASLRRVPADRVPRFLRYYQGTPTSCRPSRRASFPSRGRYHGIAHRFAPDDGCARPSSGLGLFARWPQPGFLRWRRQDLPSSWGTPIPVCPCSPTPAGRCVPDHDGTLAWPPRRERQRRRRQSTFEAQWHGFRADGLRITMLVTRHRARLASRCWSGSPGQAFTRRAPTKGFQFTSCVLASFSKLLGTIPVSTRGLLGSARPIRHSSVIEELLLVFKVFLESLQPLMPVETSSPCRWR